MGTMRLSEAFLLPEAGTDADPALRDRPRVSVLVRSLGRAELQQALDSVALQTLTDIELVVVAVRNEHPPLPPRLGQVPVRLIGTTEAVPRSAAANRALDAARGEYLLFLDDDDWLMPDHLAGLLETLKAHPAARAAYTGVALVDAQGQPQGQAFDLPFDSVRQLAGNLTPIHAVLFSRALLDEGCRFDETLDHYEDWDFWLQLAQRTVFVHRPGVSAVYRIHDSSGVHRDGGPQGAASQQIYRKWMARWTPAQLSGVMERVWSHAELEQRLQHSRQQLAAGETQLAQQRGQAERQLDLLQQQQGLIAVQAQQLQRQQVELAQQVAASAEQARQLDEGRRRLAEVEHLLARHMQRAERLAQERQALLQSSSWRLTAPLRALGDWRLRWRAARAKPAPTRRPELAPAPSPGASAAAAVGPATPEPCDLAPTALDGRGAEAFAPLNLYLLPPHGERRISLLLDRLLDEHDAQQLAPLVQAAVTMANERRARLRVIGRLAPPDGAALDRLLQHLGLELQQDSVLCHAPWNDPSAEFDRLHDEPIVTASARNLGSALASVEASQLLHWMDSDEPPDDALLRVLRCHAGIRLLSADAEPAEVPGCPPDLALRIERWPSASPEGPAR